MCGGGYHHIKPGDSHGLHRNANQTAYGNPLGQSNLADQRALAGYAHALAGAGHTYTHPNPYLSGISGISGIAGAVAKYKPIENAGIRAGEIIAPRAWRYGNEGLLISMAANRYWAPNEPMQGDIHEHGDMGVHAFKSMSEAINYASAFYHIVFGKVALWGQVIEHELGYRAEYGKVHSVDFILKHNASFFSERRMLRKIRHRYGLL